MLPEPLPLLLGTIGTPITGNGVSEATIPGKCAAPPAPAIITLTPRAAHSRAYANILLSSALFSYQRIENT